jgi:signal recognition particle subunit SRP54
VVVSIGMTTPVGRTPALPAHARPRLPVRVHGAGSLGGACSIRSPPASTAIVKRLRGKGRLTEADVDEVLKEIRTALLEADVNVTVVRSVVNRIREHAIGATPSARRSTPASRWSRPSTTSSSAILGGETLKIQLRLSSRPPWCSWPASRARARPPTRPSSPAGSSQQGRNPLLVGADLQRPAAVEQLRTLGRQIDVPVYSDPEDPVTHRDSRVWRRPSGSVVTS